MGSKPEKSQVAEPDFFKGWKQTLVSKIRIEGADYKDVGELFVLGIIRLYFTFMSGKDT